MSNELQLSDEQVAGLSPQELDAYNLVTAKAQPDTTEQPVEEKQAEANTEDKQEASLDEITGNAEPLDELEKITKEVEQKQTEEQKEIEAKYSYKAKDGQEELYSELSKKAHELNMTDEQYTGLLEQADKIIAQNQEVAQQESQKKLASDFAELKKGFGAEATKNINKINEALKNNDMNQKDFLAMSEAVGMKKASDMLLAMHGSNSSSDIADTNLSASATLSSQDIQTQLHELGMKVVNSTDTQEQERLIQKMDNLSRMRNS